MARTSRDRMMDDTLELMDGELRAAVAETLRTGSPEPGRDVIDHFLDVDDEIADEAEPDEPPPGETLALITLGSWLTHSGRRVTVDVDGVLAWIGEHLGNRYRLRARMLRDLLEYDGGGDALQYAEALGDDFLPAMIWLAAGVVAVHGDGDADWLEAAEG